MKKIFLSLLMLFLFYPCLGKDFFIIGDKEGDAELIIPRKVEEGPDGNIYIYDRQSAFIKIYSPEGHFLRKIGGKGEGPGEIKRADGASFNFTFDKKMLYFTEFFAGHKWITFMHLSGKYHKVLKLKIKGHYGIVNSMPLKEGGFLAEVALDNSVERKRDFFFYRCPKALVKVSPEGELVSEILRTSHVERISNFGDRADLGIPFIPVFEWVLLRNNSIVFTEGLSYVFSIYDFNGKVIGEIKTPLPDPQPVTREELENWRQNLKANFIDKTWFNRFGGVIDKYKESIYKKKPNMKSISLTPGNHLLIEGVGDSEKETRPYWLTDLNGNTIKKIDINGFDLKISDHFILFKFVDEEENELVFCMKRKGKETEDLERLIKVM